MNIVEEIFRRARPEATALIAGDRRLTFGDLQGLTDSAAAALGPAAGRRIGLNCPNGIDHIVWSLAVLRCGGVLVPVAPELSPVERDEQMRITAVDAVLCAGGRKWHREAPESRELQVDGLLPASALRGLGDGPAAFDLPSLERLNPALIRFSSGTTGVRKGVVLSHETLFERVTASNTHLGFGPGDRVIWILPMAHHFAVSIILYLLHGVTSVLEDSHLGEDVFHALARHEGTALYASPFHYALLASCESARAVPSLRVAVSTAAALPAETGARFRERFGIPLRQALGIIECGLPLLNDLWPVEKPDSVGRPQRGYEAAVRDETGQPVAVGEAGELFIRGPGLVDAYLSPWMTRDRILENGWFRTGDLARQDGDGAFFLVGRTHAVINVGGMKCFPEEVEAVLCSHPAVAECRISAAAHPTFGSVPVAEIVPAGGGAEPPKPSELMGWCRARLSSYKLPVKFSYVAAIPKTASGKIQR
jgi:long-chain acyl-CoA synthetase